MSDDQKVIRAVRRLRVEAEGLEDCDLCGGAAVEVDDPTLRCVCAEEQARRLARFGAIAHEHSRSGKDRRAGE